MACGACLTANRGKGETRVFATDPIYLAGRKVTLWIGECKTCGGMTGYVLTMQEAKERLSVGWFDNVKEKG